MQNDDKFPDGMIPLGAETFHFSCHSGVKCFTSCCKNVDMFLFPYDIIRLKNRLGLNSELFMRRYTRLSTGSHPYFPAVMLKLNDNPERSCPFLTEIGCSVYADRPSACRTYPLERAVDRTSDCGSHPDYYFLTHHTYCLGHHEKPSYTPLQWIREQQLQDYNVQNDRWAELDTIFLTNPWKGEGSGGPRQQIAFMVCYNVDEFRVFVALNHIFEQFQISKKQKKHIESDDVALLQFGFEWLKFFLGANSSLQQR
ncbi:MAG: putative Fe-S [Desulfobulbaceae bacterium]|jgi:Fe-S-cluster containining protein|nr:MAG: putative Fe-S [Desulfobulbaceae bacterium]